MTHLPSPRRVWPWTVLLAALALVACSSGSSPGSTAADGPTTDVPATVAPGSPTPDGSATTTTTLRSALGRQAQAGPPTTDTDGDFTPVFRVPTRGDLAKVRLRATKVASFPRPTKLVGRPGSDELYVAERAGRVEAMTVAADGHGTVKHEPVLDIRSATSTGGELGLLGLAFSADGGTLYVSSTDRAGNTVIAAYEMAGDVARASTRRVLLSVRQPYDNHKGGDIALGPDGRLWLGLGDGGSEDDPDDTSQNPNLVLGKMLRIDPAHPGHASIWATGLRNPWRWSFDPATGDLWIGDVGQDHTEEIDHLPAGTGAGTNFGWSGYEGTNVFRRDRVPKVSVPPVFEMDHADGWCAVAGGFVYRGTRIPALDGAYLFSDYCRGGLHGLRLTGGAVTDEADLGVNVPQVVSVDHDDDGSVYLVSIDGGIYRIDPA